MKKLIITGALVLSGAVAYAQSAVDAYRLSQPDLKGTARYMSMAGAFGALGGDLSTLSHNPAGIGVYRKSDVGFTLDLDLQNSESTSNLGKFSADQTKFLLNNIGFVWTMRLPSSSCPNLNLGFTYNKSASFNRKYKGGIGLTNSLSNYIAANSTASGYSPDMLLGDNYDPYNPPAGNKAADWLSILGYDGYLFSYSQGPSGEPKYVGQWGGATSGTGFFDVAESGGIDSYNIAFGGNIANVVFWGMDFDITHMNYNLTPIWQENLTDAVVGDDDGRFSQMSSKWQLNNYYNCSGTGFNYKLGFIVKPIQEFRIGFAFETPTWYSLTETFAADLSALYNGSQEVNVTTNNGDWAYNNVNFRTPWKLNASAAAVLFNRFILSAEYEWTQFKGMKYSEPSYWGGGDYWNDDFYPPWDWYSAETRAPGFDNMINYDSFYYTNQEVKQYYRNTNTLRLGAEFVMTPQLSVRAGYSYVSSPVKEDTRKAEVVTVGTMPNYRLDNTTNYVTCGLGYKIKSFYVDLAYVYKHMSSEFYAFSPLSEPEYIPAQKAALSLNNSQIVLSAGFKF